MMILVSCFVFWTTLYRLHVKVMKHVRCRLLTEFYSRSSSHWGHLGSDAYPQSSCFTSTAPAFLLFAAINAPFCCSRQGFMAWCKLAAVSTIVGWAWVLVRS